MGIENLDTKQELGRWIPEYLEGEPLPMGCVDGVAQAITPGRWTPLTLENGFTNYTAGYNGAAYRTTPGNGVQLRGLVTHASVVPGPLRVAVLPASLRPGARDIFTAYGRFGELGGVERAGRVDVWETGELIYLPAEGSEVSVEWISLANVIYWPGA